MEVSTPQMGSPRARVAVIGAASSLGSQLLRVLSGSRDVGHILAVDASPPPVVLPRVQFCRRLPESPLADLFLESWVDRVVFLAPELTPGTWPCRPLASTEEALGRTLDGCHRAGINFLLATSTGMVYLPSWDRPAPRPETSPAEGGRARVEEVRVALRLEQALGQFAADHPELKVVITRAALSLGPESTHFFSRILSRRRVLLPAPMAPMGLVNLSDLARAITTLTLSSCSGVFNIAPDDVVDGAVLADLLKGGVWSLRPELLNLILQWGWVSRIRGITEVPPSLQMWLSAPWLLDSERLRRETGFKFRYTSEQTLRLFLQERGLSRPSFGVQHARGERGRDIGPVLGSGGTQHSAAPAAGGV